MEDHSAGLFSFGARYVVAFKMFVVLKHANSIAASLLWDAQYTRKSYYWLFIVCNVPINTEADTEAEACIKNN